jgi:SAM-dependent methyltransferase
VSGSSQQAAAIPSWGHYYDFELSWRQHAMNVIQHLPLLVAVRRLRPQRILEVGTGTGSLSIALSYFNSNVTSLDSSTAVLERAVRNNKRLHGRVRFETGDAFELASMADGAFDVVVTQGFFEHFQDDEIEALLREQLRVARRAVFSVPNRAYARQDRGDERLLSQSEWESLLTLRGFHLVSSTEYRPISRRNLTPAGWRTPPTMYLATVGQ